MPASDLTIAIIHHRLRGYPEACIESLLPLPDRTELLLVRTQSAAAAPAGARVMSVAPESSRAAAKNLAVAEARGEFLLLATADTTASPATVKRLRQFLGEAKAPVAASAQLLQENGMTRRTEFALPSIRHELNLADWLRRRWRFAARSRKPPSYAGAARRAEALHATFLMARRETFRSVGEFAEGYRFACEDLEWSWRARKKGVALCILPDAPACKLPPQLKGMLAPEVRVALEASRRRCLRATRGDAYARAFRATRAAKSLAVWLGAAGLSLLFRAEKSLADRAAVHRAIWKMPSDAAPGASLPPDIESQVRWENLI